MRPRITDFFATNVFTDPFELALQLVPGLNILNVQRLRLGE